MTKKEAVENHRKMWRWIAEKTFERKRRVEKEEYFIEVKPALKGLIYNNCFCCEYTFSLRPMDCDKCPIKWNNTFCMDSYYGNWLIELENYWSSAIYAVAVAKLPERETEDFDVVKEDEDENFDSM